MRIPPIPHRKPPPKTPIEAARRAALETGRVSADAVFRNARRDPAKIPVIDPAILFNTPEARRAADQEGPDYVRRLTANMVHRALEGEIRFPRDDLSIYHVADRLVAELDEPKRAAARKAARIKRVDAEIAKLRDGFWDRGAPTSGAAGAGGEPGAQRARPIPVDRLPKRSITSTRTADPISRAGGGGGGGLSAAGIAAAAMAAEQTRRGLIEWFLDPSRRQIDPGGFFPDLYDPTTLESTDQAAREGVGGEVGVSEVTEAAETSGSSGLLGDDSWLASLILFGIKAKFGYAPELNDGSERQVADGADLSSSGLRGASPSAGSQPLNWDGMVPENLPDQFGRDEERPSDAPAESTVASTEQTSGLNGRDALSMDAAEPMQDHGGLEFPEIPGWNILDEPVLDGSQFPPLVLVRQAHEPERHIFYTPEIPVRIQDLILQMYGSRGGPNTRRWLRALRYGVLAIARELGLTIKHVGGSVDDNDENVRERVLQQIDAETGESIGSTRQSVRADLSFECTNADGEIAQIHIQTTDNLSGGALTSRELENAERLLERGNNQDYVVAIAKSILDEQMLPSVLEMLRPIIIDACGNGPHSGGEDRLFTPDEIHQIPHVEPTANSN